MRTGEGEQDENQHSGAHGPVVGQLRDLERVQQGNADDAGHHDGDEVPDPGADPVGRRTDARHQLLLQYLRFPLTNDESGERCRNERECEPPVDQVQVYVQGFTIIGDGTTYRISASKALERLFWAGVNGSACAVS